MGLCLGAEQRDLCRHSSHAFVGFGVLSCVCVCACVCVCRRLLCVCVCVCRRLWASVSVSAFFGTHIRCHVVFFWIFSIYCSDFRIFSVQSALAVDYHV
jgi:hypothetical protein